jgi:predicted thioesterase
VPARPGLSATVELVVTDADTARAMRSGSVPTLATPRLLALCEEASVATIADALAPGQTTVGASVRLDHLAPTGIGQTVRAEAKVEKTHGRRIVFTVSVSDDRGLVAVGRITRVIVDEERFIERAG